MHGRPNFSVVYEVLYAKSYAKSLVAMEEVTALRHHTLAGWEGYCHEIFGPGQNLVRPDKICQHIWSAPATNGPTCSACV